MPKWWDNIQVAWGLLIIEVGIGGVVTYLSPQIGIPIFILLVIFGIGLLIKAYKNRNKSITKVHKQGISEISKPLIDILTNLHRRNLILKDKALKQYKTLFSHSDFLELLKNISATNGYRPTIDNVKKDIGRKKLSKDSIKKRQQVDGILGKLSPLKDAEWTLEKITSWSYLLDKFPNIQNTKYKGIKKRQEEDSKGKRSHNKLNSIRDKYPDIFSDESLSKMIDEYLGYSFGGSSILLTRDLFNEYVPVELQPTLYVSSGIYSTESENSIERRMARILEDITGRMEELTKRGQTVDASKEKRQLTLDVGKLLLDGKEILVDLEQMNAQLDSSGAVSAELKCEMWYEDVSKTLQDTDYNRLWFENKEGLDYRTDDKSDYVETCKYGLDRLEYIKQLIFDKEGSQT